ncbi:MAG: fibronectin type III-like domain-contianing protein [Acidobacteriota bacterium]
MTFVIGDFVFNLSHETFEIYYPGETETVMFSITPVKLAFDNREMKRVVEPGRFQIWAAAVHLI